MGKLLEITAKIAKNLKIDLTKCCDGGTIYLVQKSKAFCFHLYGIVRYGSIVVSITSFLMFCFLLLKHGQSVTGRAFFMSVYIVLEVL